MQGAQLGPASIMPRRWHSLVNLSHLAAMLWTITIGRGPGQDHNKSRRFDCLEEIEGMLSDQRGRHGWQAKNESYPGHLATSWGNSAQCPEGLGKMGATAK